MDSNYSPQPQAQAPAPVPQATPQPQYAQAATMGQSVSQAPQYQTQGSVAMQPQYQPTQYQPTMGQVVPFPTQAPQQQQEYSRQTSTSPTEALSQAYQQQTGLVDRLVNLLTTPVWGGRTSTNQSQSPAAPSPQQDQYPQANPYSNQPQYQESRPTYGTNQTSSPNYSPLSQQDLTLLQGVQSPNAIASVNQISDNQIPYSPSALNAYSVELEDRLVQLTPMAEDAVLMRNLMTNPQQFAAFTDIYLQQALNTPGGFDHLTKVYLPIIQAVNAQNAAQQEPQYAPTQQQPANYQWGDGQIPNAREVNEFGQRSAFPEMPNPQGQRAPGSLDGVSPDQMWQVIDTVERQGAFRNKLLIQQ
ncbi:MAG: hypothetical protein LH647_10000 [Leptolyngbyaceae cyanobacterium CAN_BIN12]|nr:hypothetical protein [Leptolyngbyaceae cyanobacterium CAN_BIN12]